MARTYFLHNSFAIAWRSLQRNRFQTVLTMIGMTIGVATVLTMMAIGSGAQGAIEGQVRAAGMNVIIVTAGNYKMQQQWTGQGEAEEPTAYAPVHSGVYMRTLEWTPGTARRLPIFQPGNNPDQDLSKAGEYAGGLGASDRLSLQDADAITALNGVQFVSAGVNDNISVSTGGTTAYTRIHGEGKDLASIRRAWVFPSGHFLTSSDIKRTAAVVVLGSIVSQRLFGETNPVGKDVSIRGKTFRVIGVVDSGSWIVPAAPADDQFDAIYVPVTTAQLLLQKHGLDSITVSTASTGDVTRVTKGITSLLRQRHNLAYEAPDDFVVSTQARKSLAKGGMRSDIARAITGNATNLDQVTLEQLGKTLDRASRTMTALLASIASVSLVVGGIGIMNIMLLSVTERTREIGIRRAVGARSDEVMLQFLMESVTLSVAGGILGVLFGVLASGSITRMVAWSTNISVLAIALSFGISAAIGILFGYYPAREASRVTPMTSLRYE